MFEVGAGAGCTDAFFFIEPPPHPIFMPCGAGSGCTDAFFFLPPPIPKFLERQRTRQMRNGWVFFMSLKRVFGGLPRGTEIIPLAWGIISPPSAPTRVKIGSGPGMSEQTWGECVAALEGGNALPPGLRAE